MLLTCIEELQLYTLHAASITGGGRGFQICPQETILLHTMKTLKVATQVWKCRVNDIRDNSGYEKSSLFNEHRSW